jgi:hypothetical protein
MSSYEEDETRNRVTARATPNELKRSKHARKCHWFPKILITYHYTKDRSYSDQHKSATNRKPQTTNKRTIITSLETHDFNTQNNSKQRTKKTPIRTKPQRKPPKASKTKNRPPPLKPQGMTPNRHPSNAGILEYAYHNRIHRHSLASHRITPSYKTTPITWTWDRDNVPSISTMGLATLIFSKAMAQECKLPRVKR